MTPTICSTCRQLGRHATLGVDAGRGGQTRRCHRANSTLLHHKGSYGSHGNAAFQPLIRAAFDVVPEGQLMEAQASACEAATEAMQTSESLVVDVTGACPRLLDVASSPTQPRVDLARCC